MNGHQLCSGTQHTVFCRKISFVASSARDEGGVAKKWRMMTRGRGGVTIPPKIDDVIYEQPLMGKSVEEEEKERWARCVSNYFQCTISNNFQFECPMKFLNISNGKSGRGGVEEMKRKFNLRNPMRNRFDNWRKDSTVMMKNQTVAVSKFTTKPKEIDSNPYLSPRSWVK